MLAWIERHAVRAVLLALGLAFLAYELSALVFAYSADAYVTTDVVTVAPEVAGPIRELKVTDNQHVAAGELLLLIEPQPFEIAVASATASLELARQQAALATDGVAEMAADIASRQARLADAQAALARIAPLARDAFATRQQLDDARRDEEVAEAALRRAQVAVMVAERQVQVATVQEGVAQAALDQASYALARTRLVAPEAARVVQFEARAGDRLAVGQPVLALALDSNWRVVANVTERHLPRIAPGGEVLVMLGSDAWRIHRGTVRSVGLAVARSDQPDAVLPYIPPHSDWIRLPRRFPVEIDLPGLATRIPAFRGGNARVLVLF